MSLVAWVDAALGNLHDHHGSLAPVLGYGTLFAGGLAVGLLSVVFYERWMRRVGGLDKSFAPSAGKFGPGAMTVVELAPAPRRTAS